MQLVQNLIVGTLGVLTTLALLHMRNVVEMTGKTVCSGLNIFKPSKFLFRTENIKRLPEIYISISTGISVTTVLVLVRLVNNSSNNRNILIWKLSMIKLALLYYSF